MLSVLIIELRLSVLIMGVGRIHNYFVGCFVIISLGDGLPDQCRMSRLSPATAAKWSVQDLPELISNCPEPHHPPSLHRMSLEVSKERLGGNASKGGLLGRQ